MSDDKKKANSTGPISSDDRFTHIGFDTYPSNILPSLILLILFDAVLFGLFAYLAYSWSIWFVVPLILICSAIGYVAWKMMDEKKSGLFKNEADKARYIDSLVARRNKGELIREDCTLMEERISLVDRIVLSVACVVVLASLFSPWYSVHNSIEETYSAPIPAAADSLDVATTDSLGDSLGLMASTDSLGDSTALLATTEGATDQATSASNNAGAAPSVVPSAKHGQSEEILHGYVAKKKYRNVYEEVSGIGSLISIGSIGSYLFSSGFVLMLTAIIALLLTLLALGLPLYTLYGIWGSKGTSDQRALMLKKILRLNWTPLVLFVLALFVSFFGADYSFDAATMYTSLGDHYSIGTFFDTLSWGIIVMIGAFILMASKGAEI